MQRTDAHRPSVIDPAAYTPILYYSLASSEDGWPVPSIGVNCELDNRSVVDGRTVNGAHAPDGRCCVIGLRIANVTWAPTGGTGSCSVCGAHYVHGQVWRHNPSGEHIHIGHDCADKYEFLADSGLLDAWRQRNGELRRAAAMEAHRAACEAERADFLSAHPGLPEALALDHHILADLSARFRMYRSLSEAQIKLALKIADEIRNPAAAEAHVPAPEGKQAFRGLVVATKCYDSPYGTSIKMTVKITTPDGSWLAWGTAPAALLDATANHGGLRGHEVEVTATLKRGRDAHFAIFSRPRGAVVACHHEPTDAGALSA